MPGFDRTGPQGLGPGTGRRLGRCFGFGSRSGGRASGYGFFGGRRGNRPRRGFCQRFGLGFGGGRFLSAAPEQERDALLEEKSWLEGRLNAIKERLSSIGS